MAETDPKDWLFTHQIVHGLMRVRKRGWIARAVGEKNSVGIESEHFFGCRGRRHNSHLKAFLAQQAQNVFLDPVIVGRDSKLDRWKRAFISAITRNRPRRAELVLQVPAVNF